MPEPRELSVFWGNYSPRNISLTGKFVLLIIALFFSVSGAPGMGNYTPAFVRRGTGIEERVRYGDGKTNRRLGNPRGKFNTERRTGGRGV